VFAECASQRLGEPQLGKAVAVCDHLRHWIACAPGNSAQKPTCWLSTTDGKGFGGT
jgi:hypothetical protein